MEIIKRFIASDGEQFSDEHDAWVHEKHLLQNRLIQSGGLRVWHKVETVSGIDAPWFSYTIKEGDDLDDVLYRIGHHVLINIITEEARQLIFEIFDIFDGAPTGDDLPHCGLWYHDAGDDEWQDVEETLAEWSRLWDLAFGGAIQRKIHDFLLDTEKMYDFVRLTKDEFLQSYSYLTEDEYDLTSMKYSAALNACFEKTQEQNDKLRQILKDRPDYMPTQMEASSDGT